MNFARWAKPMGVGVFVGAVAATGLGFGVGGWMTASKAEVVANEQAKAEVSDALLPICLDLAGRDDQRAAKIETIRAAPLYRQNEVVGSTGWTTMPGTDNADIRVARACVEALLK